MVDLSKMPKRAREQWVQQQLGKPSEQVQRRWQEEQALAQLRQQQQQGGAEAQGDDAPVGLSPEEEAEALAAAEARVPAPEETEDEGEWQDGGLGMVLDLGTLRMMKQRGWLWLRGALPTARPG
jgi:hypothetical protein